MSKTEAAKTFGKFCLLAVKYGTTPKNISFSSRIYFLLGVVVGLIISYVLVITNISSTSVHISKMLLTIIVVMPTMAILTIVIGFVIGMYMTEGSYAYLTGHSAEELFQQEIE